MKIFLNEQKFSCFLTNMINEQNTTNPYSQKIEKDKESLEKLLNNNGIVMNNIQNGKDYVVYELQSLNNVLGKRYCICRLIKDGEQYGQISTKPLSMFRFKNY